MDTTKTSTLVATAVQQEEVECQLVSKPPNASSAKPLVPPKPRNVPTNSTTTTARNLYLKKSNAPKKPPRTSLNLIPIVRESSHVKSTHDEISSTTIKKNVAVVKGISQTPHPLKFESEEEKTLVISKEEENISIEEPHVKHKVKIIEAIIKRPQIPPKPILKNNNNQTSTPSPPQEIVKSPPQIRKTSPEIIKTLAEIKKSLREHKKSKNSEIINLTPPPPEIKKCPPPSEIVIKPRDSRRLSRSGHVVRSSSVPVSARRQLAVKSDKNNNKKIDSIVTAKNLHNLTTNQCQKNGVTHKDWKKSQSSPLIQLPELTSIPKDLTENDTDNNSQFNDNDNSQDLKSSAKPKSPHKSPAPPIPIPIPVAPPRQKRKSLVELSPPNTPVISFQSSPPKNTQLSRQAPIYTKGSRVNRKWPYRRNARKFSKNRMNTEKTSLLVADDEGEENEEDEDEDENENGDEEEEELMRLHSPINNTSKVYDKWTDQKYNCTKLKSSLNLNGDLMDGVKERSCLETVLEPSEEDEEETNKENSTQNVDLTKETLELAKEEIALPSLSAPVEVETELCDNKSFLFTLINSPTNNEIVCDDNGKCHVLPGLNDCATMGESQQKTENNNNLPHKNSESCMTQKYQDIPTVSISECESDDGSSSQSKPIDSMTAVGTEEEDEGEKSDLDVNSVFEDIPLVSISECDSDSSFKSKTPSRDLTIVQDGDQTETEKEGKSDYSEDSNNKIICDTKVDHKNSSRQKSTSCLSSPKPKRKNSSTSLLDLVDMEIQKVQSLLSDMATASKRHSIRKKSVTLSTEQPKAVLLRKSSVPELRASIVEFEKAQKEEQKLVRHSWATKSTSSVGSTTSSSSLGSNLSKSKSANMGPPIHNRQRRKSDFTPLFWADEGDSSTGAMGDVENSPYHSSNEEIRFLENSGRSTFRRRRTVADFLGKARKTSMASFANASMIWKQAAKKKHHSELIGNDVPKIQIVYADGSSSDGRDKESKNVTFDEGDEDEDEYRQMIEMKKKSEFENYETIQAGLSPKGKKSFYVVREILTSEKTFVDVLHLITLDFPKSLKKTCARLKLKHELISEPDLEYILGGLPILKGVNEDLLHDLEERVSISKWTESSKIADIFVKKGAFLKHYTNYIKDFEKISKFFDHYCEKNQHFANAVRIFERSKRCHNLGLKPYMLKPVQRMPQYALLLEDYLKNLEVDHEDYEDTLKAINIVKQVAEHANESIKTQTAMERLIHLQERLPNIDILGENKHLIKEGELLKVCRKDMQPRHFALMNDSLLCMTYNNSSSLASRELKIKYNLPLTRMRVMMSSTQESHCEFSIIAIARSFNVVAKSVRDREEWVEALTTTITEYSKTVPSNSPPTTDRQLTREKLGKHAPIWVQDSRASMCQVCTESWGIVFRRHHCRACGKVVCRYCSSNEAPLEYLEFNTARVCDVCYFVLLNECEEQQAQNPESTQRRLKFKKFNITKPQQRRTTKYRRTLKVLLPLKPEVKDGNTTPKLSGHLEWKEKKTWRRNWFVLIDCVLYIFAACEDSVPIKTLPVLGYTVEIGGCENDGTDEELSFTLKHKGRGNILFQAESTTSAKQWMSALNDATVLSLLK